MPSSLSTLAFIGDIGGGEIILVFLVVLMLFGGEKMPELARSLGKALREIKKATSGVEEQLKQAMAEAPPKPRPAPTASLPAASLPPVYTPPPAAAITPVEAPPPASPTAPLTSGDRHPAPGGDKA
ncbi:MAG: twin-arginine translocase TatA/TatE family subunit [Opitutus sp.]|nr:twin-arginine translocase TatA/TatE family subunit [Opitutus sp.]MCS6246230.1 twin-arginine translocase TatA/TatE family subunit [Opitutus sp.]MCS6277237.1 twin-arginine translocase TatA/TatE family subunit [Opitutus sp.]MCS6300359.1 twin-arginine translocase TatA/TatE family subunit [Opitutus sp.]